MYAFTLSFRTLPDNFRVKSKKTIIFLQKPDNTPESRRREGYGGSDTTIADGVSSGTEDVVYVCVVNGMAKDNTDTEEENYEK